MRERSEGGRKTWFSIYLLLRKDWFSYSFPWLLFLI